MAHQLLNEAKRQAEKLPRYLIKRTTTKAWRVWRHYDEWKPVFEAATQEACEDYVLARLGPIADTPGDLKRTAQPNHPHQP